MVQYTPGNHIMASAVINDWIRNFITFMVTVFLGVWQSELREICHVNTLKAEQPVEIRSLLPIHLALWILYYPCHTLFYRYNDTNAWPKWSVQFVVLHWWLSMCILVSTAINNWIRHFINPSFRIPSAHYQRSSEKCAMKIHWWLSKKIISKYKDTRPQNVYFDDYVLCSDTLSKTQAYDQFHLYCCIDVFINYHIHYDQCSIVQKALANNLEWTCIAYSQIENCCYIAKSCDKLKH